MDKDLEDVNKRSGTRKVWKSVLNSQIIERGVYTTISFWKGYRKANVLTRIHAISDKRKNSLWGSN